MTARDQEFARRLAAGQAAALAGSPPGTHPPGPNPLRHIDHPVQGFALGPTAGVSLVPAPLNQPAAPAPRTRTTGAVHPRPWPVKEPAPRVRGGEFDFPYRGPWTGFGKDHV